MSPHQFKNREERIREQKRKEILEVLAEKNSQIENQNYVNQLLRHYDISKSDAKKVVELLGGKNALAYTDWFFNSPLDKRFYLISVEKVAQGVVTLKELTSSPLEYTVQDDVKKFNLSEKQLEQRTYMRPNPDTGTRISADNPYNSQDTFEHLDSRSDRSPGE